MLTAAWAVSFKSTLTLGFFDARLFFDFFFLPVDGNSSVFDVASDRILLTLGVGDAGEAISTASSCFFSTY